MAKNFSMEEETDTQSRSPTDISKQFQGPAAFPSFGDYQMIPIMYPTLLPSQQNTQQQINAAAGGPGIYAVPVAPAFMGHVSTNTLIPLTYTIPTATSETGATTESPGQQQRQPAPQRQVVIRRFQIAFQLDLLLMLKLAAVIFLFNQDGSRQRYQTGALTPLIRWLSQSMQRAARPPQPPRAAVRADNIPAGNDALPDGQVRAVDGNEPAVGDGNQVAENENAEPENGGNHWWGIVKEVQMIVIGFITSLLPGFHNID
ncbi:hypothetical protein ACFE04_009198 [Oxalis oulophora]